MKSYNNLDKKIRAFKQSRVPDFIEGGDFEFLLRSELRNRVGDIERKDIYREGKEAGLELGVEEGIKNFIIGGKNQISIANTGETFPFNNIDELLDSEKTKPYIEEYNKKRAEKRIHALELELEEANKIAKKTINSVTDSISDITQEFTEDRANKMISDLTEKNRVINEKLNNKKVKSKKKEKLKVELRSNKSALEKLNSPKKIKNQIKSHNNMINNDNADKSTLRHHFSRDKNRETAILKTDNFSIYTIPQIQKHLNSSEDTLEDIRNRSNRNFDKLIPHIVDKRTNPIKYERTIDYFDFPSNKVNERFQANPANVRKFLNNNGI